MPPATRWSSMELDRPMAPPKCHRPSPCLPLPGCGSRTAPWLRSEYCRTRSMLEMEVSQRSATVRLLMSLASMFSATRAVWRSSTRPFVIDIAQRARKSEKSSDTWEHQRWRV